MLSNVAAPMHSTNLCDKLLLITFSRWIGLALSEDYLRLRTKEILLLCTAFMRRYYFARCRSALFHAVLKLNELLKEDLQLEVLVNKECCFLLLYQEEYCLKVINYSSLQWSTSFEINHHKEVKHVILYIFAYCIKGEVFEEVDEDIDYLV